ncbi:MAG: hypothetical protein Q8L48_09235 [Archangium sp.]|nr:hypothetical protein [Archangium sp.]
MLALHLGLVLLGIVVGNVVFNNFEKHLPWWRRVAKHGLVFGVVAAVRILFGGWALLAVLGALTIGQVVLHAWYFPRHGVNGLTAEPYERYLALIARMKR